MKRLVSLSFAALVSVSAFGQGSAGGMSVALAGDSSIVYSKNETFDYVALSIAPSISMEFSPVGMIGAGVSGIVAKSILSEDSGIFLFAMQTIDAFGQIRLLEKEATTVYASLTARIPIGSEVDAAYEDVDYICNSDRRWSLRLGGHIDYIDDPAVLATEPYFGYDLARGAEIADGFMVIGNTVASAFALTDELAFKVVFDMRYDYPLDGRYLGSIAENGMSSSITFSFVQNLDGLITDGGIRRSLAIIGQTAYVGSASYVLRLNEGD